MHASLTYQNTTTYKQQKGGHMNMASWDEQTLSVEGSLARTYPLRDDAQDLPDPDPVFSGTHSLSRRLSKRDGLSWRTCQDFYQATRDAISESSSLRFPTQGIATSSGEFWIRNSSEFPNVVVESSLSHVLETSVDDKYLLSPKACAGVLRRASRRGKTLPEPLAVALEIVAGRQTPTE